MKTKYLLVPSIVKRWLIDYLKEWAEDEGAELVSLCPNKIDDYSSEAQVNAVVNVMREAIDELCEKIDLLDSDIYEIYLVCVGGVLHNLNALEELRRVGINPVLLVYEKKIDNYVRFKFDDDGLKMV